MIDFEGIFSLLLQTVLQRLSLYMYNYNGRMNSYEQNYSMSTHI